MQEDVDISHHLNTRRKGIKVLKCDRLLLPDKKISEKVFACREIAPLVPFVENANATGI